MHNKEATVISTEIEKVVMVNPKTLVKNKFKAELYEEDNLYYWFCQNVRQFGMREPIIADEVSKMVISGNRRLKAALEIGLSEVPVIFRALEKDEKTQIEVFVSHEVQREKTYSQYLKEYQILREKYPMTQGTRTDLGEGMPSKELEVILKQISRSTMFYLVKIDEMAKKLYTGGEKSDTYKRIWKELDTGVNTPARWYKRLMELSNVKEETKVIKDESFVTYDCRFLNKSADDLCDLKNESVSCFVSSLPTWGVEMPKEKNNMTLIGSEKNVDDYIDNLIKIFKGALPKLKKGGSIWVNVSDVYSDKTYNLIPHRFALKMKEELELVVNDEIVCARPPKTEKNKRGARGFEYLFQFVRSKDTLSLYHDESWLNTVKEGQEKVSVNTVNLVKKQSSYWDFRDGIIETDNLNIRKLKNSCKKMGIKFDERAKLTIEEAMVAILSSTVEGDLVADLFGGIGTTALVAGTLKRKSVSYEINPECCKTAYLLLGELVTQKESEEILKNQPLTEYMAGMEISDAA